MTAVYPKGLEAFLSGQIDVKSDAITAQLVTAAYTYSPNHQYASSLTGLVSGGIVLTSAAATITSGVYANASSVTWAAVTSGATVAAVVIYAATSNSGTSPLIAHISTRADTVPISVVTDDDDITVNWPSSGIFKI